MWKETKWGVINAPMKIKVFLENACKYLILLGVVKIQGSRELTREDPKLP